MRWPLAILLGISVLAPAVAAPAKQEFFSSDAVLRWINSYRLKPDPADLPNAVRALSRYYAFKDPDTAGVYVGFIAGIIGSNPARADEILAPLLPLPEQDQWIIVRAIAYSGLPDWKALMTRFVTRLPARQGMIDRYLLGETATLDQVSFAEEPSGFEKFKRYFHKTKAEPGKSLEINSEVLDTFWGYYFATGSYRPIERIIDMLPWSKISGDADKLTVGSLAKFTLVSNAARDRMLLTMLKEAALHRQGPAAPVLREVIDASETVDINRVRREALAAIEEFKSKGSPGSRNASFWGTAGQTALAAGCLVASATGHAELGVPCVVGGAMSSAAMKMIAVQ